jgi:outer membrane cobalamin receptor
MTVGKAATGITAGMLGIACMTGIVVHAVEPVGNTVRELDAVVVTTSRRETALDRVPEIVQVIDRQAIEAINPSTTGELLAYTTGSSIETGTGVGMPNRSIVSLNGLPASYTLVLVDGVKLLSEHIHTGQNLDNIPPAAIERIEIMRGSASAQYGTDAIGGIVNIVTRRCGDQPAAEVSFAAGSYNTYEGGLVLMTPIGNRVRLSSFAHWEASDGIPIKAPAHRLDRTGYSRLNALARLDIDVGAASQLFTWLHYTGNTMERPASDPRGGETDMMLLTSVLGMQHALSPSFDFAWKTAHSYWDNPISAEKNTLFEPQAYGLWRIAEHTLMAGGEFRRNEFTRSKVANRHQNAHGVFLQHEWSAPGPLATLAALRYDDVDDVSPVLSPKAAVRYSPIELVSVRLSLGRGFHAPTLQERFEEGFGHGGRALRFGNPDLKPEYSTTAMLGLDIDPIPAVRITLHGYYSQIENMIVPVYRGPWDKNPSRDVWERTNIADAEVYGGEASLGWTPLEGLSIECGYTYTENENRDTGRQLPYQPGSALYGRLALTRPVNSRWRLGGWTGVHAAFDRAAWNWKPTTGADADSPDGLKTELKDYTRLDAGLSIMFNRTWEWFAKVENILGKDIEHLDDAFTVLDGKPMFRIGAVYKPAIKR